jgi:hypothetical protein
MWVSEARWNTWNRREIWLGGILLCGFLAAIRARAGDLSPARESFDVWHLEEDAGQQTPITAIIQSNDG